MPPRKLVSLRVDDDTQQRIARLARVRRSTQSAVIREAIAALAEKARFEDRPYEAWKDGIAMIKEAPADLSVRTGRRFRRLLVSRRKGRR